MERITALMPRARTKDLVIEELPDETLVYDLKRHKAHYLNRTAALVWRHCDGRTTLPEMAAILEEELDLPRDEEIFRLALDRLRKAKLLDGETNVPGEATRHSRRELVRKLAVVGGLSILLPIVKSINSPVAAMQGSTTTLFGCNVLCQGIGLPCAEDPDKKCEQKEPGECECS